MAMLVCSLQFAMAGDVVTRDVNKLPVAAREMIGKHFSQTKVAYIKIEKDLFQSTSYDVNLWWPMCCMAPKASAFSSSAWKARALTVLCPTIRQQESKRSLKSWQAKVTCR